MERSLFFLFFLIISVVEDEDNKNKCMNVNESFISHTYAI